MPHASPSMFPAKFKSRANSKSAEGDVSSKNVPPAIEFKKFSNINSASSTTASNGSSSSSSSSSNSCYRQRKHRKDYKEFRRKIDKTVKQVADLIGFLTAEQMFHARTCNSDRHNAANGKQNNHSSSCCCDCHRVKFADSAEPTAPITEAGDADSKTPTAVQSHSSPTVNDSDDIRFLWYDKEARSYKSATAELVCSKEVKRLRILLRYFRLLGEEFLLMEKRDAGGNDGLAFLDVDSVVAVDGLSVGRLVKLQRLGRRLQSYQLSRDFAVERNGSRFFVVPVEADGSDWRVCGDVERRLRLVRHLAEQQQQQQQEQQQEQQKQQQQQQKQQKQQQQQQQKQQQQQQQKQRRLQRGTTGCIRLNKNS